MLISLIVMRPLFLSTKYSNTQYSVIMWVRYKVYEKAASFENTVLTLIHIPLGSIKINCCISMQKQNPNIVVIKDRSIWILTKVVLVPDWDMLRTHKTAMLTNMNNINTGRTFTVFIL